MTGRTRWLRLAALAALAGIPGSVEAQGASESGSEVLSGDSVLVVRVLDMWTDSAVASAAVFLPELGKGGLTDDEGVIRISGVAPGTWEVQASSFGYGTLNRSIDVEEDWEPVELSLEPDVVVIEGLTATAEQRGAMYELRRNKNARQALTWVMNSRVLAEAPHSSALHFWEGRFGRLVLDMVDKCPTAIGQGNERPMFFFLNDELVSAGALAEYRPGDLHHMEFVGNTYVRAFTQEYIRMLNAEGRVPPPEPDAWDCHRHGLPVAPAGSLWKAEADQKLAEQLEKRKNPGGSL